MTKYLLINLFFIFSTITIQANAITHKYTHGRAALEGAFFPASDKKAPGIVLVHNWMGVTAETEKQAQRFQQLGYNVLAADIYGAGVRPQNTEQAGSMAAEYKVNRKQLRERLHAAIEELSRQPGVDKTRIAVIGYCFGGTAAIEAARNGENIRAAISFHGGLDSPTPADGAKIKTKILALHGAIDPYVAAKDIAAFESEMQTYKVDYELIKYSGAVHSFTEISAGTDNSKGAAYNSSADERSFARAMVFLKEAFN
jgi:dienelactone hydrolase